ncbi:MAG: HD-GYP domain-containing protein [Bdellovibrionota bacterium]
MKPHENILNLFAGAAKARELYPPTHPARKQSITSLLQALAPDLSSRPEAVIGIVEETIVYEDRPLYELSPALEDVVHLLVALEIKAIHIRREAKPEDLLYLFELIPSKEALQQKGPWVARQVEQQTAGRILVLPEVPDAHKVYNEAISYMGELLGEIRMGQIPKPEKAMNVAKNVSECVLKNEQAILGLTMIKSYDNYLFNHSVNVCVLSMALAKAAGLQDPTLTEVGLGGLLHDIGKTRVPIEILGKPGRLTPAEWEVMKTHSTKSYEIIQEMGKTAEVTARCAREHHVQYDHQGYPYLGPGAKAHPFSHLVAVADCYDAITTLRSYQKQTPPYEALRIMDRLSGTKLDPSFFKTFVAMLGLYPPGSVVRLDSNEIAVVVENHVEAMERPKVKIIFDSMGRKVKEPFEVDLARQEGVSGPPRAIVAPVDPTMRNIDVSRYLNVPPPSQ